MKKRIMMIAAIAAAVIAIPILTYSARHFDFCGHFVSIDSEAVYFEGDEIKSLEELRCGLSEMRNLRYADFGTYRIPVTEVDALAGEYPKTQFRYGTYVTMYGKSFNTDAEVLDLSSVSFTDSTEFVRSIHYFTNLSSVNLGSSAIPAHDRDSVRNLYPDVDFDIIATHDLYGKTIREDAEEIDLSDAVIESDARLLETFDLFPSLKYITLGETAIPGADRDMLRKTHPDVNVDIVATYDIYGTTVRDDVTTLDMKSMKVGDDLISKLKLLPKLESVDLHGKEFNVLKQLEIAKAFPNITFAWDVVLSGNKVDSLSEKLDLSYTYLPPYADKMSEIITYLFPKTTYIDMCDCSLSNEELGALREALPNVKLAWRLYMGKWSLRTDQVAFSVLIYTYNYRPLTASDIEVLKYCTDLQALDLGHQWINDISVIGEYLTDLRILILADNNLTDLSPLAKLPHLHYLEFFVNQVTDLTPLAECKQLVDLNISYNHGLYDITPLLDLPKLERLWLEHCIVSNEDVALLRATYPNATIISEGTGSIDQGWRAHDRYFAMIDMYMNNIFTMSEEFSKYD